jgi:hypothetical protein
MVEKKSEAVHKLEQGLLCKCFTPSTKDNLAEEKPELGVTEASSEDADLSEQVELPSDQIDEQKDKFKNFIYLAWYGVHNGTPLRVIPFQNIEDVEAFYAKFEESCYLTGTKPTEQCRYYIQTLGDYKCEIEPVYPFPAVKKAKASSKGKKKRYSDDDSSSE